MGDDQIKAEESTPTMTEPKKETLEELELSKTNNQLTKKLAMFENTLKSVQNDIVIPLKERITRLELEKKGLLVKNAELEKEAKNQDGLLPESTLKFTSDRLTELEQQNH